MQQRRSRFARFAPAALATAAALIASMGTAAAAPPSPVDDVIGSLPPVPARPIDSFYTPPEQLPEGEPGDVIKQRRVATPTFPNMTVTQVMYLSTNQAGDPVAVTGALMRPMVSPMAKPRGEDAPLVALSPGTRGQGNQCAPSKFLDLTQADPRQPEYQAANYQDYMARGISVFVTDYLGGGTPARQEYLVGRSEGQNDLDAARAAMRVDDGDDLTENSPVGLDGYSQGGQTAAWANEIQPDYAPELNVVGAFIDAPPTDMVGTLDHFNGSPTAGAGIALAAISGVSTAYPELDFEQYLTPFGERVYDRLYASCVGEELAAFGTITLDDVTDPDVSNLPAFREALAESQLGTQPPAAPAYITNGSVDTIVPPNNPRQLYANWCDFEGVDVTFTQYPALEHLSNRPVASVEAIEWLANRLAGAPAEPGCRENQATPVIG